MSLLVTKGARALVKTTSSDDTARLIFILRAAAAPRRAAGPRARAGAAGRAGAARRARLSSFGF